MGLVLKLSGVRFNNPNLPTLEDFGVIPQDGLLGLWDFNSPANPLMDASGGGNDLRIDPTGNDVVYNAETRTFRFGQQMATKGGQLNTTKKMSGIDQTVIIVYKGMDNRSVHFVSRWYESAQANNGVSFYLGEVNGFTCRKLYYPAGGGINNSGITSNVVPLNKWAMFAFASDENGVAAQDSLMMKANDGAGWVEQAYGDGGPQNPVSNATMCFGRNTSSGDDSSQVLNGDVALIAVWDRKLTDSELRSAYKAIQGIVSDKGIDI
ncbi:hypothetical protein [Grimontia hollisae]|uniref:hypothetical protein n=1 Tax=Grimontia hollisae TaxID=673 RepID=UPI0012AD09D0|nr:hypothetical protein [Grimontia hollisae]